jgi:hypothetical protein
LILPSRILGEIFIARFRYVVWILLVLSLTGTSSIAWHNFSSYKHYKPYYSFPLNCDYVKNVIFLPEKEKPKAKNPIEFIFNDPK